MRLAIVGAICAVGVSPSARGHGVPINVFVDPQTMQLYALRNFTSGPLLPFGGPVYTEAPGIGVANPGNGVPDGASIGLNILEPLWYADATGVTAPPPGVEIVVHAPTIDQFENEHISPIPSYSVTESTGYQSGMTWGTYVNSPPGWDAHGVFELADPSDPAGIYALVVQVTSPGFAPSDPILIPMEYDPFATFELEDVEAAIDALRAQVTPLDSADFSGDGDVDGDDFLTWQSGFGIESGAYRLDGDADADGDVDGDDFLAWQSQFGSGGAAEAGGSAPSASAPEPSSLFLLVSTLLCLYSLRYSHFRTTPLK